MNLKTFFQKFDQFADAPDAVAKMRELVRHLAVAGRLVAQNGKHESASKLLERIAAHKSSLSKAGQLRGTTSVTPMANGEGAFALPSNWIWVRFGEIVVNRDGERIPVSKEERATKAKTYDYYGASGVIDKIDDYLFDKPLLLIGEDGANLINRSTPIAFMARGRYWVNNHAHVLDGISEDFLRYIELHINAINLESYVTGSAQPKMNQAKMNSIPIALPPLAEQKRIVAKVDELMALCDRLEAQQKERETRHAALARASLARFADAPTPANLNFLFHKSYDITPADLRKSILTLAVQGKLVPQDPNDEPVRKQKLRVRSDDDFHEIPNGWVWTFWEDVLAPGKAAFKRGPFGSSLRKSDFVASGYKVYEQYCPINDDCSFARYYITRGKFEAMKSFAVQAGDFLISCSGVTLGRITQVPDVFEPGVINQALLRVRIEESLLDSLYFKMLFRTPFFQERIFANSTGSAIPNVKGVKDLKAMPIPVPPIPEQRRIVAKVDQLMALVDQLETQLAASRATAENLLEALVAELTNRS
jgi:type I restriction enzyme, S subunit